MNTKIEILNIVHDGNKQFPRLIFTGKVNGSFYSTQAFANNFGNSISYWFEWCNVIRGFLKAAGICSNCYIRPATEKMAESATMFARGYWDNWCKICVLTTQIKHAKKCVEKLPELEKALEEIMKENE